MPAGDRRLIHPLRHRRIALVGKRAIMNARYSRDVHVPRRVEQDAAFRRPDPASATNLRAVAQRAGKAEHAEVAQTPQRRTANSIISDTTAARLKRWRRTRESVPRGLSLGRPRRSAPSRHPVAYALPDDAGLAARC